MMVFTVEEKPVKTVLILLMVHFQIIQNEERMEYPLHSGKKTKHVKAHMRAVPSLAGREGNLVKIWPSGGILPIVDSFLSLHCFSEDLFGILTG